MRDILKTGMKVASLICCFGFAPILRAYAGDINAAEQSVIDYCGQIFIYEEKEYAASSKYLAQLRSKLNEDGINLSMADAQSAINQFESNIARGVAEGYLIEVKEESGESGEPEEPEEPNEPGESGEPGEPEEPNEPGDQEEPGTSGESGNQEESGTSGESEAPKEPGTSGETGDQEKPGASGETGEQEKPGMSGEPGDQEGTGTSGELGDQEGTGTAGETGMFQGTEMDKENTEVKVPEKIEIEHTEIYVQTSEGVDKNDTDVQTILKKIPEGESVITQNFVEAEVEARMGDMIILENTLPVKNTGYDTIKFRNLLIGAAVVLSIVMAAAVYQIYFAYKYDRKE